MPNHSDADWLTGADVDELVAAFSPWELAEMVVAHREALSEAQTLLGTAKGALGHVINPMIGLLRLPRPAGTEPTAEDRVAAARAIERDEPAS
jgi:hypothetical protein